MRLPALTIVDECSEDRYPGHDVVDGAVKFDANSPWHSVTPTGAVPVCKEKPTKAVTHQRKTKNKDCQPSLPLPNRHVPMGCGGFIIPLMAFRADRHVIEAQADAL